MNNPHWLRTWMTAKLDFQMMRMKLLESWNGKIPGEGFGQPIEVGAEVQDDTLGAFEGERTGAADAGTTY